jgi:hypothetical protein
MRMQFPYHKGQSGWNISTSFKSNGVTVTAPGNRDIYKIGAGMDLIRLFKGGDKDE